MPEDPLAYFELKPPIGLDPDGTPQPLADPGIIVDVPTMDPKSGQIVASRVHLPVPLDAEALTDSVRTRVIPGTRIVETSNVAVVRALNMMAQFERIDEPSKTHIAKARRATDAHIASRKADAAQVATGDAPAPDVNDEPNPDAAPEG